jgi:hypothetical protein
LADLLGAVHDLAASLRGGWGYPPEAAVQGVEVRRHDEGAITLRVVLSDYDSHTWDLIHQRVEHLAAAFAREGAEETLDLEIEFTMDADEAHRAEAPQ